MVTKDNGTIFTVKATTTGSVKYKKVGVDRVKLLSYFTAARVMLLHV